MVGLDRFQRAHQAAALIRRAFQQRRRDPHPVLGTSSRIEPQHLERAEEPPRVIPDVLDVALQIVGAIAIRQLPAGDRPIDIAREVVEPVVADREAEILGRDIFELVRFVDDRVAGTMESPRRSALAHRRVRAQEMMVDDHQVRFGSALPHPGDETVVDSAGTRRRRSSRWSRRFPTRTADPRGDPRSRPDHRFRSRATIRSRSRRSQWHPRASGSPGCRAARRIGAGTGSCHALSCRWR